MFKRVIHSVMCAPVIAILLGCGSLEAQTDAAPKSAAAVGNAETGKRLFLSVGCQNCHGERGQGTATGAQIAPPPELSAMVSYVRQPAGKMPSFSDNAVSDEHLADIYAFLKSIAPPSQPSETPAGDAANGKRLFGVYGCYECHDRQGQGASTAPRIGPPRISFSALLRYVRQPTGQMPPYTAKVVTDQELADIYSYLNLIPPPPPAANFPLLNQ